jgi:hypothetical protein
VETNPIPADYHEVVTHRIERTVDWTEPGLKILRLRLLSDPGFPMWDVSYCHGVLDGEPVSVQLPFSQLKKKAAHYGRGYDKSIMTQIVDYAKADGIFAKNLGIFDAISTLN